MKFLSLVFAHLLRSKRRTFLTVSSIAIALFLFCALRTVMTSLDAGIRASDDTRLVVRHAASLVFPLPLAYRDRLLQIPGVTRVGHGSWFGGYYQDPKNNFTQFAVDVEPFFDIYPEVLLPAAERSAFEAERTACIAGQALVDKYGWKIGDVIPITGTIFPGTWPLTLRGIYKAATPDADENAIFFNWEFVNQSIPEGRRDMIGIYWLKIASASDAPAISARVDALYENSARPTKTETEKAFNAGFISMMGNVSLLLTILGSAIVFAIMLVTINTMMMAARERTTEIAILKTIGFSDGLVLGLTAAESMLVSLAGGLLGCGVAAILFRRLDFTAGGMIPNFRMLPETFLMGIALAVVMGILSGAAPAFLAARLQIAGALRKVA